MDARMDGFKNNPGFCPATAGYFILVRCMLLHAAAFN